MIRFLLTPFSWVLRALPRSARFALGRAIGNFLYAWSPRRRAVAEANLAAAYPELAADARARLAKETFQHHGHFAVESIEAITWSRDDFRKKIKMVNLEVFDKVKAMGKGGVLLACHLGNWELSILGLASQGVAFDIVVKEFKHRPMEKFMTWFRSRTGAGILHESVPPTVFWKAFSQNRLVCFVLDQFMGPPIGIPVKFFGQDAGTAAGLALITERSEVPVIPVRPYRDAEGNLGVEFFEPLNFGELPEKRNARLYHRTQKYNDAIERNIRVDPAQWTWIHRRWKNFVGTPRWVLNSFALAAIILVTGCAGGPKVTETGIPLPPDPQIATPVVETAPAAPEATTPTGVLAEEPAPAEAVKAPEKKKAKKKVVAKAPEVPKGIRAKSYDRLPFEFGEQQVIEGSWMGLPAGRAVLEVRRGPEINGRKTILFWGNALSSRLVDTVLHVDNTMESYVDAEGLFPYKFLLHMVETYQVKETRVAFDHPQGRAFYWAKRISKKMGDMNEDRIDGLVPLSQDMWSGLFFIRMQDFELGKKFSIPIYENNKNMKAEFEVVGNELVRTKAGVFQTWKLSMELKLNNVLRPSGAMHMWVSDDSKKYLVKFDVKLNLGSLAGELVSVRDRQ